MAACIASTAAPPAATPLMVEALAWPHRDHPWETNETRTAACLDGFARGRTLRRSMRTAAILRALRRRGFLPSIADQRPLMAR